MKRLSFAMLALLLPAGCQTGGSASNVPQVAIDACLQNADAYQKAAPGTATFNGKARADVADPDAGPNTPGDNWALEVSVAGVAMSCTVTPTGTVVDLEPF
jgi:hypothetical protein